ncbi:MAG: HNH endonuclease signature motif containing protein [Gammaproteobacteria bacterium]
MKLQTLKPRLAMLNTAVVATLGRRAGDDASSDRKRFYDSALWQRTRDAKLKRDPLCQYCALTGVVSQATVVDHYVPLIRGGHPTADDNLVSADESCHNRKTQCEVNDQPFPKYAPSKARKIVFA